MTDIQIKKFANIFRLAIEAAREGDEIFANDPGFDNFPTGSCGDTCYLLAEYLRNMGVETIWYSAQREDWSHAWLVVKDGRVRQATQRFFQWPEELRDVVARYGVEHPEQSVDITRYEFEDLQDGLIIDITGDQFEDYDNPVHVGLLDSFHQSFDFNQAHDYDGINDERLWGLYRIISRYLTSSKG